ncbi:MAG: tRNA dihydrouridine synthase DusB [Candidatus Eisenbacteria bacterium]|nr:tRNA dihydrouridine synthase DusB [Candidatus Eisenbacteria bacterium]
MTIAGLAVTPPLALAPLAGITDSPMRRVCRRLGASLVWTEMVSAEGLVRGGAKTLRLLAFHPDERPIVFQLFGARPEAMGAAAAAACRLKPDLLDINVGCPARKVVRSGAGSALMRDLGRLAEVARAVVEASDRPVVAKIRSGWDEGHVNAPEAAAALVEAGVAALVVHPRTGRQGFTGSADWRVIRAVRAAVPVPVIGNGDVRTPDDAARMRDETGCDGVMIGRAAVGNPWVFAGAAARWSGLPAPEPPTLTDRIRLAAEHLDLMVAAKGERTGVLEMRKHITAYLRGFPGASGLRAELVRIDGSDAVRARLLRAASELGDGKPA